MLLERLSRLAALLILVGVPFSAHGQNRLPIQLDISHASFAYSPEESMVELYLAVDAASLDYEAENGVFAARVPVDVAIVRSATAELEGADEEAVWMDSLLLRFALPDTSNLSPGQHFIHQVRTVVPPGEYELTLSIPARSAGDRAEMELRRDVLVPNFAREDEAVLSDITLATNINPTTDRDNPFYKNGLLVRPNANQLFGEGLSELFYYAEVYGTSEIGDAGGEYTLFAYISEANRPQPMENLQKRTAREVRSPDVLVGQFDLSALPSGSYFLRLALLNESNESVVEQSQKFFVYNPGVQRPAPVAMEMEFETSPYASLTEEELILEIEQASLIANESERRRLRRIEDLTERRRALMEFWQKRDPHPETPINEFKEEFHRRVQYANDRYSSNMQEGWQSDRGRVVIKYGLPTSVEPHLYDRGVRPYEIWNYNTIPGEGQAMFIFADLAGFGRFELIHSTVTGERTRPDWQEELRQN